jgi:hypothetical protein
MSMKSIRDRYGVPAYRGARIEYEGRPGIITASSGQHLRLCLDDSHGASTGPYHPLWHIDYLDGVDHGAAYDRRVEAFNAGLSRGATPGRIGGPDA